MEIFNLRGVRIFDSEFVPGAALAWDLRNSLSLPVANGVYLYIVTVKGVNGELVRNEVKKLLVLR